jgi:hypothetical protein
MGHRKDSPVVKLVFSIELALDFISGATVAASVGTSSLDHKIGYHSVECQAIVKIMFSQINKVLYGAGRVLLEELDLHDTFLGMDFSNFHLLDLISRKNTKEATQFAAREDTKSP